MHGPCEREIGRGREREREKESDQQLALSETLPSNGSSQWLPWNVSFVVKATAARFSFLRRLCAQDTWFQTSPTYGRKISKQALSKPLALIGTLGLGLGFGGSSSRAAGKPASWASTV